MLAIKTFFSELFDRIIANPFETLFFLIVVLFFYFLFAGFGFSGSSKKTVKGSPRAFMGRALGSIDSEIHFVNREKAGGNHLLVGVILFIASFFIPVPFSFWIKLAIIIGALLLSFVFAALFGDKFRMNYHSKKHFDQVKAVQNYHDEQKKAGLRKESIRFLRTYFDNDEEFYRAIEIYGQEKMMESIEGAVSRSEFKYSYLKTIAGHLKGRYNYFCNETQLLKDLLPGGREEYKTIINHMNEKDKKRTEFLLDQIIVDIVDWRLKDKHRAEIKTLLQGNK